MPSCETTKTEAHMSLRCDGAAKVPRTQAHKAHKANKANEPHEANEANEKRKQIINNKILSL